MSVFLLFFFSSRRRHTRCSRDWSSDVCSSDLPVTLAMTVTPDNVPHLWASIDFGLQFPHVHGITFQPMFGSGRVPVAAAVPMTAVASPCGAAASGDTAVPTGRLNTADLLLAAVEQSQGQLRHEDFTPLPCGDPNCATIGYLLRIGGRVQSISDSINFRALPGFLRARLQ